MAAGRHPLPDTASPLQPWFTYAFWGFVGAMVFSLAGLLILRAFPSTMSVFGPYYVELVKAPTWTYMALLPLLPLLMYAPTTGWPRMLLFLAFGSAIGGASELVGTTGTLTVNGVDWPFGAYAYTHWLGPKIGGHVPYFIPLSWFAMSVVSLDLAYRLTRTRWHLVPVAALFMMLWDVSLDPAMNHAFPFWTYAADGFFYGMPITNWIGWFVVSLLIVASYEAVGGLTTTSRWAPWVYGLNCLFPLTLSLLHGVYGAVAVGTLATTLPLLAVWLRRPRRSDPITLPLA